MNRYMKMVKVVLSYVNLCYSVSKEILSQPICFFSTAFCQIISKPTFSGSKLPNPKLAKKGYFQMYLILTNIKIICEEAFRQKVRLTRVLNKEA